MRLLHTADWHLGRSLCTRPLIEDQRHVLEQIVDLARATAPDAVLIAGDLYDRALPPADAVRLLDDVLCELSLGVGLAVVAIAGNHDSPDRVAFASRMLERGGVVLHGAPTPRAPLVLGDAHGPVAIHPVAFAEPAMVRAKLAVPVHDHDAALRAQLAALDRVPGRREVVVAHAFVTGGEVCEAERPLSVGTAGQVAAAAFEGFAYTALGHLHRPQSLADGRVRYAGAPLAYGFDEAGQAKSVTLVEIDAMGAVRTEILPLSPQRPLRIVRGTLQDLLAHPPCDDYVRAVLDDLGALLDPHGRLSQRFANLLEIDRARLGGSAGDAVASGDALARDVADLFAEFVAQVRDRPLDDAETAAFRELYDAWQASEREVVA